MASYFQWAGGIFGSQGAQTNPNLQSSGMLSKEQLLQLFKEFSEVLDRPDTKKRIADAVKAKQEAVNLTTDVQEELFIKMGVDPRFGIECLGKVNKVYEGDRDLMIKFYEFVTREELACEEAELGPEAFAQKMENVKKIQQQQMGMLQQLRGLPVDQQQAFLQGLQSQMHQTQAGPGGSAMTPEEIQEFFARQHGKLPQKASPPPQNFGSGNSSAGNSSHSTLHHRNS